jgi:uncharacterized RDD family membrane protein YckC
VTVTHSSDEATLAGVPTSQAVAGAPAPTRVGPTDPRVTAGPGEADLEVPPMWRRLTARALDILTVGTWVFALSVAHIFLHVPKWSNTVDPEPWGTWFLLTITFAVCYAAYEIAFIAKTGATPGKDLMRLKVADATTGERPTWGQATRRWFLPGIVQPIPGAWISGVLTAVWGATALTDPERRSIHDRLAGTRVVSVALPATEEERAERRKQFIPRFVDPFAVYKAARKGDVDALRRHPADDE